MKTTPTIDYYYSVRSSFAYLGGPRLNALPERFGCRINHYPILLSVTMGPAGAQPFDQRPPLRNNYARTDLLRWAHHLGMPIIADPVFHLGPSELPSGLVIAGQRAVERGETGDLNQLSFLILEALWRDDRNIAHDSVLAELAIDAGFDHNALLAEAVEISAQQELQRNCREAIARGVLGSPTYFINDEPFYGQDRLDFVERALTKL